ncbi:winged helix DNA-binding domain-containing protein [Planomonospora alba]|uniref:Winged helix DNA-binding domain-containing protein n=1 Tax=Planomonospora alba TaxID=161354 RepID=A0ABP6MV88_9ACTN
MMSNAGRVLSRRELNRAFLERQLLSERVESGVEDVLRHLVGLQAQQPAPPYFGLWSRVKGFEPDDLARLVLDRRVVRANLMRCTVHLVTADDCLALRRVTAPVIERGLRANPDRVAELEKIPDLAEFAEAARELLAEPRGIKELGELLAPRWPRCEPAELARIAQYVVPSLQTPPRGLWGRSSRPAWAAIESWLGRPIPAEADPGPLLLRYLAAFGPATVADMQQWSGLNGLAEVCARLELRTFRDERGRTLLDLPDAPLPGPDAPAPVRFLAEYDNAILSHADRSRIIDRSLLGGVVTKNGIVRGTVLVDGFVRATWKIERPGTVAVTPFAKLSGADAAAVEEEGLRLLAFAAPAAQAHDVRIGPVAD